MVIIVIAWILSYLPTSANLALFTTSMAIKPGTRELYILSSDHDGRRAKIYRAGAFAKDAISPGP